VSFSAACKAQHLFCGVCGTTEVVPCYKTPHSLCSQKAKTKIKAKAEAKAKTKTKAKTKATADPSTALGAKNAPNSAQDDSLFC
jgi:hypothetical protein